MGNSTEPVVAGQEHRPKDEQQRDVAVKSSPPVNELTSRSIQFTENKTMNKKLFLVLDLDHTLLNTTFVSKLTPDEIEYLTPRSLDPYSIPDQQNPNFNNNGVLYKFNCTDQRMTKLRPFVHTFLEETSRLFNLYVFTLGSQTYAKTMTNLLDPKSRYFGEDRVFSREDCVKMLQKDLDVVKGVVQSECIIMDDLKSAWNPNCWDRLIQVKEYNYFNSSSSVNPKKPMYQRKTDESESNGWLAAVLEILREVHEIFFDDLDGDKDVRKILNCTIQRRNMLRRGIRALGKSLEGV